MEKRGMEIKTPGEKHWGFSKPGVHNAGERLSLQFVTALLWHNELCCALVGLMEQLHCQLAPGLVACGCTLLGESRVWLPRVAQPDKAYLGGHSRRASDSHWWRAALQEAQIPCAQGWLRISDVLVMIVPGYVISGQEMIWALLIRMLSTSKCCYWFSLNLEIMRDDKHTVLALESMTPGTNNECLILLLTVFSLRASLRDLGWSRIRGANQRSIWSWILRDSGHFSLGTAVLILFAAPRHPGWEGQWRLCRTSMVGKWGAVEGLALGSV